MKIKIILILLFGLLTQNVFAVDVKTVCKSNTSFAGCRIYNPWNKPIYCDFYISVQDKQKKWFTDRNTVTISPGQSADVEMYTKDSVNDPITATYSETNCRFQ